MVADNDVKELFIRLAGEEINHKKTFEGMLAQLADYQPPETYNGEYLTYLKSYIDGKAIFKDHPKIPEMAKVRDRDAALDFAIQREADSILYYEEVKKFAGEKHATHNRSNYSRGTQPFCDSRGGQRKQDLGFAVPIDERLL